MSSLITARVKGGREIWANCFIMSSSDRGALMFTPSDRATRNFIAKAHDDAKKLFGDYPVILVPPRITRDEEDRPWLPPVRFVAEFSSAPMSEIHCLSTAVIIWYQNEPLPFIGDDLASDFELVEWATHAKDESFM